LKIQKLKNNKNEAKIQERFLPLIVRMLAARMLEISVISFNKFCATWGSHFFDSSNISSQNLDSFADLRE